MTLFPRSKFLIALALQNLLIREVYASPWLPTLPRPLTLALPRTPAVPNMLAGPHAVRLRRPLLKSSPTAPVVVRSPICQALEGADSLSLLDSFFKDYPYWSSFTVTALKGGFADGIAQISEKVKAYQNNKTKDLSLPRNLAFLMYAGAYQGCAQYFIFNQLFPIWFGESNDPLTVVSKVMFDMFVLTPALCLPVAYLTKAAIFDGLGPKSLQNGLKRYKYDVQKNGLLLQYWAVWIPAQTFNFGVVPSHLRIAFIAVVSFFWVIILSGIMAKNQKKTVGTAERISLASKDRADVEGSLGDSRSISTKVMPSNAQSLVIAKARKKEAVANDVSKGRRLQSLNNLLVDVAPRFLNQTINSVSTYNSMIS